MFAVLFGLSMDYEVFLLSRVREEYLAGRDTARAVTEGLARTARVITAAALIMVAVFGAFALSPDVLLKLIGVGLATAILVDATVVRMVLVPAVMQLLGRPQLVAAALAGPGASPRAGSSARPRRRRRPAETRARRAAASGSQLAAVRRGVPREERPQRDRDGGRVVDERPVAAWSSTRTSARGNASRWRSACGDAQVRVAAPPQHERRAVERAQRSREQLAGRADVGDGAVQLAGRRCASCDRSRRTCGRRTAAAAPPVAAPQQQPEAGPRRGRHEQLAATGVRQSLASACQR